MKRKALSSLLIIFVGLLVSTILLGITHETVEYFNSDNDFGIVFYRGVLGSLFAFFTYGLLFWPTLLILMLIFEIVAFNSSSDKLNFTRILVYESIIVSLVLAMIANYHSFPTWYFYIPIFLICQYLRYLDTISVKNAA